MAAAAAISLFVGDYPEAIAIIGVLAINAAIGFVTSWRAVRSMEALYRMAAVTARVRRDGRSMLVSARELIPGDILLLESGDIVPADTRLLETSDIRCDESSLTGESAPVHKSTAPVAPDTLVADQVNMAFKGTAVVRGTCVGVVVSTGMETQLGRISALAHGAEPQAFPLEKRLDKLGENLVWITIFLSALIAIAGLLRGLELFEMLETAIALAVAAVPEGLPVVATLALARGMLLMARRNTLIERLSAVETLGSTTIILTDKTGTLTENRMTVTRFLLHGGDIEVDDEVSEATLSGNGALRSALEIGALCNTAEIHEADSRNEPAGVGDPMELALLHVAHLAGIRRVELIDQWPEVKKYAFNPVHKIMATVHRVQDGYCTMVKGAPEAVLSHASQVLTRNGPKVLTERDRKNWHSRVEDAASRGFRLIGVGRKFTDSSDASPYSDLTLVGFVCLLDPLREDVPAAIAQSQAAGVRVVMMTGDHVATAIEIATQAGLSDNGQIVALTEHDLVHLGEGDPPADLRQHLLEAEVFARVSPETKLKLVEFYQNSGHVVAMTGDGVNDAPALKKADIGIAMGQRGTQVAREAAAMILKDDAFTSIIVAMRQGRVIYSNIRRFVTYLLSCNLSEILVVGTAILIGLPSPLTPLQILFLNLVTDVFPAFALGLGEGGAGVMKQPPRDPSEPIIDKRRWREIAVFGGWITVVTLGVYWLALSRLDLSQSGAVTLAFLTLALAQLWHVFNMRGLEEPAIINSVTKNPYVWGALGVCIGLIAAVFFLPAMADVLELTWPGGKALSLAIAASLLPLLLGQIWLYAKRHFSPWYCPGFTARRSDRDPARGLHQGQQSDVQRQKPDK